MTGGEKTTADMVKRHYNEAVTCLNGVAAQDNPATAMAAAPLLIQTAIAHALLGQLCWQSQLGGPSCCCASPAGSTTCCAR